MSSLRGQNQPSAYKTSSSKPVANKLDHDPLTQTRLVVSLEDNRLIADILGEYDAHLALLEDRMKIEAVVHGNIITLVGSKENCAQTKSILLDLYNRASQGETIGPGEIDGAIRHALAEPPKMKRKKNGNGSNVVQEQKSSSDQAQIKTRKRLITARTPAQSDYIRALHKQDLTFATGPAGTGKTYLAVAYAASCWERGETDRIILSRPAVEAGERLGFLPGDMRDKVDPYLRPLYDALYDCLPPERVERGIEAGAIEIAPLAFMRGRTLSNAFIILDEAQNCTAMQMKMFLTRLGEKSKMVITGDPTQIDLPKGMTSGLTEAIHLLQNIEEISTIKFAKSDVVRCELVSKIVDAYETA
ncbi:MAG: PhoH family protein [Pseudomonadota bacterium]